MKELILNQWINWLTIHQEGGFLALALIAIISMLFYFHFKYKPEVIEKIESKQAVFASKNLSQGIEIERLRNEVKLSKEAFEQYKEDAMIEILNLRNELKEANEDRTNMRSKLQSRRNPDGTFAVTTGKGHRKKKQPAERDWTKASNEELLAEAKHRYPVGTRYKSVLKNNIYTSELYPDFYNGPYKSDNIKTAIYCRNGGGYVYVDGKWAEIVSSC